MIITYSGNRQSGHTVHCGPYSCPFPSPASYRWRQRWTCPDCGTTYRRTRRMPARWWRRRSYAPQGRWDVAGVIT